MAEVRTWYSGRLQRDMTVRIYGHGGIPFLVFPCQDAMSDNYESFGMDQHLSGYLDSGKIRLFCVDTVDKESFSDEKGDKERRAWVQECYYNYIIEEVMPLIYSYYGGFIRPYTTGCSLGATHAAILFFRRPDLFEGVVALSGCYDSTHFWDGWCNETLYNNSPLTFLRGMPYNHPYIALYNQRKIILCVGQGRWEREGIRTSLAMRDVFAQKGINGWVDFWGYDVDHDWPWWKKQYDYFLPFLLG